MNVKSSADNILSLDSFSADARNAMRQAQKFADSSKHRLFEPAHLLVVLLDNSDVIQVFKELGIDTISFTAQLHNYVSKFSKSDESSSLAPSMIDFINRVKCNFGKHQVNTFDLLLSLSQEKGGVVGSILKQFDLTIDRFRSIITPDRIKEKDLNSSNFITDLSCLAKKEKLAPIIGRDTEVRRVIQILGRHSKNNPLLVGGAGIGKNTIVMALVDRIAKKIAPRHFHDLHVVQLNTQAILSGVKTRNDVEDRFKQIVKTLQGYNVIVYVRALESFLVQGLNLNLNDLFNILLESKNIRVITSCSNDGLKKITEKDANLINEFTQVSIEPSSENCAIEILRGVAKRYEDHHNIKIGEGSINTAVKLAKRYVQDRSLPESAIDLIDEAASNKMMEVKGMPVKLDRLVSRLASVKAQIAGLNNDDEASVRTKSSLEREAVCLASDVETLSEKSGLEVETEAVLSNEAIAIVLGEWTGIPVNKFLEGETEKLTHMEERLTRRVVGQDEAIVAVSKSVKRSYAGLRDTGKPIGSFLFLGASGVGKTEMAKALAEFLFDDEQAMTRIDCSEFREAHMAQRLIGAPPGYEGAQEGGYLTEAVRKKPYSVLLFDEVEKAHPDVFNLLLQVLDDGRLTDGRGRTADFSNTIVIMTSNIGSRKILDADRHIFETEDGRAQMKLVLHEELKSFLRPEFINRIDETVVFRPLTKDHLTGILDIQLSKLNKLLFDRDISVKLDPNAKEHLVHIGYEPAYGARPLKRAVLRHIQDPLAEVVVKGNYQRGSCIRVSLHKNNFVFNE